jgi:hypothetical protein
MTNSSNNEAIGLATRVALGPFARAPASKAADYKISGHYMYAICTPHQLSAGDGA